MQQPFIYAFVRGSERSSDLLLQGLAHDVAVGQSGVEAHAVLLGVLLLDGAADVAGSVQAGDGLLVLGQDVAIGVDGQTCGGQIEGGVNADGPQTVAGLDVGAVAAAELIGLARAAALFASMASARLGRFSSSEAFSTLS